MSQRNSGASGAAMKYLLLAGLLLACALWRTRVEVEG